MKLREYQKNAMREILDLETAGVRKIILQAPTGSGKTAMASSLIASDTRLGRNTLVLAHRGELLDQMSRSLSDWGVDHGIIRAGRESSRSSLVQVASIQSLDGGVALPHLSGNDRIVVDECHRRDSVKITDRYPVIRRLGLSATPVDDGGGSGRSALAGYERIVVAATPRELVGAGYIVPLVILAPPLPVQAIPSNFYEEDNLSKREKVMGKAQVMGDVVKTWLNHGSRRTLCFCCGINHAKRMAETFMEAGVPVKSLSGEDKLEKRRVVLDEFRRGEFLVLLTSDLFNEGVDLPFVSRLLMLRPTDSLVVWMQQIGRGVRSYPGKADCQVFDHAGNIFTHGDPYETREWKLPVENNSAQHIGPGSNDDIWRCPLCFCCVMGNPGSECPYCGESVTYKSRRIQVVGGDLVEYDPEEVARLNETRLEEDARRAVNNERIRSLFGVAMRKGLKGNAARGYAFGQLAKFNKEGGEWSKFMSSIRDRPETTSGPSTSSLPRYNPLIATKSSS